MSDIPGQQQQQTPGPNGPAAKRRRVEIANSTLRKPFRSPLLNRSSAAAANAAALPSSLGIGQSPLRIKSRAGEDLDRQEGEGEGDVKSGKAAAAESEEEDEMIAGGSTLCQKGKGKGNEEAEAEMDGVSADVPIPASPSSRGTVAGGRGRGRGRGATSTPRGAVTDAMRTPLGSARQAGALSSRRYPSPSKSTIQAASTATPRQGGVLPSRNIGSSSFQTPSKKAPPLFSSTGTGSSSSSSSSRNPKTPGPTKRTNATTTTSHVKEDKPKAQDILTQLRAARKETQSRLAEAQKQLDLAKQARRIQEKKSIEELLVLIEKWKCASRTAAEDLFELIRKRVDDMGGSRAWRDSRRRQQQGWGGSGFDEDETGHGRKKRNKRGRRGSERGDDYGEYGEDEDDGGDGEEEEEEDDDENGEDEDTGFTMAMMLQSLNIDPEQLGWDPQEEKWLE